MCELLLPNKRCFQLMVHLNGYHVLLKLLEHLWAKNAENEVKIADYSEINLKNQENIEEIREYISNQSDRVVTFKNKDNPLHVDYIFNIIYSRLKEICVDENGCCFIQRTLDLLSTEKFGKCIISKILVNTKEFSQHPYANYVIQYLILNGANIYKYYIFDSIKNDLFSLSLSKHSSRIIDRLITNFPNASREIISILTSQEDNLKNLLINKHGNYGK